MKMNPFRFPSVLVTVLCLTLSYAQAEPATETKEGLEPVELPPVTVESTPLEPGALTQPSPEQQAEKLQAVPGGTNLIDETQYKTGRASNLQDILQRQPGVFVTARGTEEVKISIRGSAVDRNFHLRGIRVLQDGIPISQADGSSDFQWIEPLSYRNVEVYRGGNALEYGSTTLGGALNFVSPTGYTAPALQARIESGSYGYVKGQVSSGNVIGKLDYYLSSVASYQNGYQEHSRNGTQRYTGNIGYRFSPDLETRFYGGYTNSKLQLTGNLTREELMNYPRGAAPNSRRFDERHDVKYTYLANKTTKRFGENQQLDFNTYWIRERIHHPLFWNAFFLNGLGLLELKTNTYGGGLRYQNTNELFGHKNTFILGVSPQMSFAENNRYQNRASRATTQGLRTASSDEFSANFDIYGENQYSLLKDLALVTGYQASYAVRNYYDRFDRNPNGNQTRRQDYFSFNPKAGLRYNLSPNMQMFANYSKSFEPPTQLEIVQLGRTAGNVLTKKLQAQRANTLEIGTRGAFKRLSWDTTFYRSWVRHELLTLNDSLGNPIGTVSGSRTYHQGIEAGSSLVLAEGLFAKASKRDNITLLSAIGPGIEPTTPSGKDRLVLRQVYDWTYLRFRNDATYDRNRLPGIPPQRYRSELIYEHPSGFYIQPNLEMSLTKFAVDYANSQNVRPYAVLGIKTGYRSKKGWSAYLELRNLTNRRYPAGVQVVADARGGANSSRVFSPGQGFSVYGGVELKW